MKNKFTAIFAIMLLLSAIVVYAQDSKDAESEGKSTNEGARSCCGSLGEAAKAAGKFASDYVQDVVDDVAAAAKGDISGLAERAAAGVMGTLGAAAAGLSGLASLGASLGIGALALSIMDAISDAWAAATAAANANAQANKGDKEYLAAVQEGVAGGDGK